MRNLTITRRKSLVGCAMKDQVYIRDELAYDIFIDGVPCRKIGNIKNGESKTFQIEEEEQQVFLIADKVSKDYCNATVTIPEGQEDIALSGIHKFYFGSNPFRFDCVQLSEEQLAKQKKNNRKGAVIMIAASIIGLAIGLLLSRGLFGAEKASPTEVEGFFSFYRSKSAMVFTVREEETLFGDITLEEYGDLVLKANGRTGIKMNQDEGFIWFEYTDTPEEQEIYYLVVCCRSEDAFWIVNFATPATNRDQYKETFLSWAKSIKVG